MSIITELSSLELLNCQRLRFGSVRVQRLTATSNRQINSLRFDLVATQATTSGARHINFWLSGPLTWGNGSLNIRVAVGVTTERLCAVGIAQETLRLANSFLQNRIVWRINIGASILLFHTRHRTWNIIYLVLWSWTFLLMVLYCGIFGIFRVISNDVLTSFLESHIALRFVSLLVSLRIKVVAKRIKILNVDTEASLLLILLLHVLQLLILRIQLINLLLLDGLQRRVPIHLRIASILRVAAWNLLLAWRTIIIIVNVGTLEIRLQVLNLHEV